jgi:tRNA 5-methylaminomethyl-2-thiouridine biosynthesis bifunctional protein
MNSPPHHALIDWDDQGRPHSRAFDDVYFSLEAGLAETRYVFLEQNRLAERFAALPAGGCLVIGETGFGTGLNFLSAWQLFESHAHPQARLEYLSVEKYPLTPADLRRALALWPTLAPCAEPLLEQYVAVHAGFQRLELAQGRVSLTLLIGDALEQLPQLDAEVDAWFLDGFNPAKNPDMWTPELFAQLARLSRQGTTLGTFTSTGWVRRGLAAAGFKMKRVAGIGHKWHIARGEYLGWPSDVSPPAPAPPWFARPPASVVGSAAGADVQGERHALVIGAGLAGCASAASLAARGWRVTLLERHADLAQEASGNPQGVLYLKLSAHGTALSRLIVSGFGYTRRLLERLQRGNDWDDCGVLQLAFDEREAVRQAKLGGAFPAELVQVLDRDEAQRLAGIELGQGGLFYPEGGWVHPPALCRLQASHPLIALQGHRHVLELRREQGLWQAWDGDRLLASAPVVVLANAAQVTALPQAAGLPLKRIRGQITRLAQTAGSQALKTVVCAEGYVAPARLGEHTLGASFDFHSDDLRPTEAEHRGNLELLSQISPDLHQRLAGEELAFEALQGRAAFRCTSPDYLPIVGPLAEAEAFEQAYAALAKDARQIPRTPCPWLDGLYINSGHGSRGLITAPLSGELIAAWICRHPLPVPLDLAHACHPNRFALRRLIRHKG